MQVDFAKAIWGDEEILAVDDILKNKKWLASGEQTKLFEEEFAKYVGVNYAVCVNSGSSANLLAISVIFQEKGKRIIASGCGFPATLSPLLHCGFNPILCDYELNTHNADVHEIIALLETEKDIGAVILAHTLGNPVDLDDIRRICKNKGIYLIEDCCEAVGSKIYGESVGKFADISTFSFYPAHQITAGGGGGMLCTNNKEFYLKAKSLRDWGKIWDWDTKSGDIKTNFTTSVDGIPYYAGYTYETLGFNFKLPEICCAFGRVQLTKLDEFARLRLLNYDYMRYLLNDVEEILKVETPEPLYAFPAWFGFPLTLKDGLSRNSLVMHLESNGIRTRPFFAGNITRHKPFYQLKKELPIADKLMRDSCFIGTHPDIKKEDLEQTAKVIKEWITSQ